MVLVVAADSLLCLSSARTWAADTICTWSGLTPVVRMQAVCNQCSVPSQTSASSQRLLARAAEMQNFVYVPPEKT